MLILPLFTEFVFIVFTISFLLLKLSFIPRMISNQITHIGFSMELWFISCSFEISLWDHDFTFTPLKSFQSYLKILTFSGVLISAGWNEHTQWLVGPM